MVTLVRLFLGLVVGIHPITVAVGEGVAEVELLLDGRSIGVMRGEPWTMSCDLGDELVPHVLVAVARDSEGQELGRDEQWINLPRRRSEIRLMVEPEVPGQPRYGRLIWGSVVSREPDDLTVTFDGEPLPVVDPERFELPLFDAGRPHFLSAEAQLGGATTRAQLIIGGGFGQLVTSDLTAIPVLARRRWKTPRSSDVHGCLTLRGDALQVVAVERSGAEVVLVRDGSARVCDRLQQLRVEAGALRRQRSPGGMSAGIDVPRGVEPGDRLRVLLPIGELAPEATAPTQRFPLSPDLSSFRRGVVGALTDQRFTSHGSALAAQRIADGVAVAGLAAAAGGRARAVVLVVDSETEDHSGFSPASVRRYLEALHVPLLVWSPQREDGPTAWGEARDISTGFKLAQAVGDLGSLLERQAVVWVMGRHLPQDVVVGGSGCGRVRAVTDP